MKVKILGGSGLHKSEVKAVERMERELRESWHAFASLLVADDQGSMDIDVLIITHDRLLLVELKEWNGVLESSEGQWFLNGKNRKKSPYEIKRVHALRLANLLQKEIEHKLGYRLLVEAHVVLCGSATPEKLSTSERRYVHTLEDFLKIKSKEDYEKLVEDKSGYLYAVFEKNSKPRPNSKECLPILQSFFSGHRVRPKEFKFHHYIADEKPWFKHRLGLYSEFRSHHEEVPSELALMRRWDMAQLGVGYATQDKWASILLRESRIFSEAKRNGSRLEQYMLRPLIPIGEDDIVEETTELYEIRRSTTRLDEYLASKVKKLSAEQRIDLVRALIVPIAELHSLGMGHRDIDTHNLWHSEEHKSILVSSFSAAYFPEKGTVSEIRQVLKGADVRLPEDIHALDGEILDPYKQDVFLLAMVAFEILFKGQLLQLDDGIPVWSAPDQDEFGGAYNAWFGRALSWEAKERFSNAAEMLAAFNQTSGDGDQPDTNAEVISRIMSGGFVKRGWNPFSLYQNYPPAAGEVPAGGGKVAYRCQVNATLAYCKFWIKAIMSPDNPGMNRRILRFRQRLETVIESGLPTSRVIDAGLLESGGLFVVTEYESGLNWADAIERVLSAEDKNHLALGLIKSVIKCHSSGISHGDIHPQNLLVTPGLNEEDAEFSGCQVKLIDMLDFGDGSDPFNGAYSPKNGALTDAFGRDRYAVYMLIQELFGSEIDAEILQEIEISKSQPGMVPISLEPLLSVISRVIEKNAGSNNSVEQIKAYWGLSNFRQWRRSWSMTETAYTLIVDGVKGIQIF